MSRTQPQERESAAMMSAQEIDGLWRRLDSGEAVSVLQALQQMPGQLPGPAMMLRALALLETREHEGAVAALRELLAVHPDNPVAPLYLAIALFANGQPREAGSNLPPKGGVIFPQHTFITKFIETFWPLRFSSSLGMALIEPASMTLTDPFSAEYEKWIAMRDRMNHERLELLEKADTVGESAQAVAEAVRGVTQQDGSDHRFVRNLGDRYHGCAIREYHRGNKQLATLLFARAHELRPANEMYATHFASLQTVTGDSALGREALAPHIARGVEAFDKTRKSDSLPAMDTVIAYAWCLHDLGEHEDALRSLSLVHPDGPDDLGANFLSAVCWLELGNRENFRRAMVEWQRHFFIDTWEQIVSPFIGRVAEWLKRQE